MAFYERKDLSYDDYVYMQGRKYRDPKEYKKILNNIQKRKTNFSVTFDAAKKYMNAGSLLCLGARTGDEVEIAKEKGFDPCIGIDLYPIGEDIIKADWHHMPFTEQSFDNVYTNSIDHCYDVEKLAKEVLRVLKQDGIFYFQLERKKAVDKLDNPQEHIDNHANDFLFWDKGIDLANAFVSFGFALKKSWSTKRWNNFFLRKS